MYVFLLQEFFSTQVPGQGCHGEVGTSGALDALGKIILKLTSYKEFFLWSNIQKLLKLTLTFIISECLC